MTNRLIGDTPFTYSTATMMDHVPLLIKMSMMSQSHCTVMFGKVNVNRVLTVSYGNEGEIYCTFDPRTNAHALSSLSLPYCSF